VFTPEDIQARVRQRVFVPVRIVTSAGQSFDIYHPDLIMVGRRFLIIGSASNENPSQFDRTTQVSIVHVTALEDLPMPVAPAAPGGNGSQ
jgi:hypothetical protein